MQTSSAQTVDTATTRLVVADGGHQYTPDKIFETSPRLTLQYEVQAPQPDSITK